MSVCFRIFLSSIVSNFKIYIYNITQIYNVLREKQEEEQIN